MSHIEIIPTKVGSVSVRNHALGLERTYRMSAAGEAVCVSRSGTTADVTKVNLENMDSIALQYLQKEAKDGEAKKAA